MNTTSVTVAIPVIKGANELDVNLNSGAMEAAYRAAKLPTVNSATTNEFAIILFHGNFLKSLI